MEYPATQRFVDDEDELEEEDEAEENSGTPVRMEKKIKVGLLLVDSVTYPIYKGVNRVGRINSCSIIIDHSTISKRHAEIEAGLGSKSTFISDLGSMNKTKLNDAILRPKRLYQLQDGDVIRFGSVKAVFKVDVASRNIDEFVIPETPAPIAREVRGIIPATPDLSFENSPMERNRSSDVSLIAGTQEGGNVVGRMSPRLSLKPWSQKGSNPEQNEERTLPQDISEMETQKNFSIPDSDEENIFEMPTQQSDIHDDETQRFTDNVRAVMLSKYTVNKIEPHSQPSDDIESQKFSGDHEDPVQLMDDLETQRLPVIDVIRKSVQGPESNIVSYSINDLETQKFDLDVPRESIRETESRSDLINDLETQKPDGKAEPQSCSIHDIETQKPEDIDKNCEDSETDEEGIFENSDAESVDMFNAPTQVIKVPRSPGEELENAEDNRVVVRTLGFGENEIIQEGVEEAVENVEEPREKIGVDTDSKVDEEKRPALNDSIESKLNHMFDDVNETTVEEPTQMLTQHLENVLESTQVSDRRPCAENVTVVEKIESKSSPVADDDGEDVADSDDSEKNVPLKKTPNKSKTAVIRIPKILSTQELFADLPAVDIFRTPRRGRIKISPLSDGIATPKSEKPEIANDTKSQEQNEDSNIGENRSNDPKRPGSKESTESVTPKRSKRTGSKANEVNGRKKPGVQNDVVETPEEVISGGRKELPLKKRGSSILSGPPTPRKSEVEIVVSTGRPGTRSSRSSVVEIPKDLADSRRPASTRANPDKPEGLETGSPSRRLRKKPLVLSASEEEEAPPVKRPRTTTTNVLPQGVNDGPRLVGQRGKRTNAGPSKINISESSDPGMSQNESLSTRSRRGKGPVSRSPSLVTGNLINPGHQPSLESQEIQAILGVADEVDDKVPEKVRSRFNTETRGFRNEEDPVSLRPGLTGLRKTDLSEKEVEGKFEKPVGRSVRRTRYSDRTEPNTEKTKDADSSDSKIPSKSPSKSKRAKIPEVVNEDDLPKEKSSGDQPGANKLSKKTTTTRQRTKRYPLEKSHISSDDDVKEETFSQAAPKSQTKTTPVRRKRVAPRNEVENTGKENVIVEIAPKRRRKTYPSKLGPGRPNSTVLSEDDELQVSQTSSTSSPLRRGRSSLSTPSSTVTSLARVKHKILFTGLNDPGLITIVNSLGGTVTEKPNDCTALVTDKVRRTYKFLCGMAMAVPIVSLEWLKQSEKKGRFLDTGDYLLKDPIEEAKFKFDLRRSLARATENKLLDGYTVVLTPNTAPPPIVEMKGIIQACGGKALARPPTKWPEKSLIISRLEDIKNAIKFSTKAPKSVKVLSVEFILTGILRHELNFEEHELEID